MNLKVLGRTNQAFSQVWLSLKVPQSGVEIDGLAEAMRDRSVPIEVSSQAALWGAKLRGYQGEICARSSYSHERSDSEKSACDLTQAHLIETLSALGRETLDFYFLTVRRALEEFQISGVLQALESARTEGHIRFFGLWVDGNPLASRGLWQFNDAFDVIAAPTISDSTIDPSLDALAHSRRVGVIVRTDKKLEAEVTQLVSVHNSDDVNRTLGSGTHA